MSDYRIIYPNDEGDVAVVVPARQAIREKYEAIQTNINNATDADTLKNIIDSM